MTAYRDWRDLPFRELWVVDTEYYPGAGKNNGGRDGDQITPLCLVAHEMRSGRTVQLWQDELGHFPPYRLDADALFMSYMLSADFGVHLALGWGEPACALDPYVEFRHCANNGAAKAEDREKGFYSLGGALRHFHEDEIDVTHKKDMRDRIIAGPPFSAPERKDILEYCGDDVHALVRLVARIVPTIRSLPHAMFRAKFMWAAAQQERRGVPLDLPLLTRLRAQWGDLQAGLVDELGGPYDVYEIDKDGKPHWRSKRFEAYLTRNGMSWPRLESGALSEREQTFRDMEGKYPQIGTLRELRYALSKLRLHDLAVGNDGRNRCLLSPFGTKTGRNTPSASRFVFGPAKWLRFLITPPPGLALVHRDYKQQEVRIAAVLSGDSALLEACESGDVYLGIAGQLGFLKSSKSEKEVKAVRTLFKTVVLGIQYGLGCASLAVRTGISLYEAAEILARLRARFCVFEEFATRVADRAGLTLELTTAYGWVMQCPPGINPRTVRNFPVQATGADVLHVACILAERRGIRVVAPVHDAIMAEAPAGQIADVSAALDQVMRDAAVVVLRGYELPTDEQLVLPGERYRDDRPGSISMWETVTRLMTKLERQTA